MSTTSFSNEPQPAPSADGNESGGAKEQAQQAAGTAKDEGRRVAGVAKDEAQRVTGEARTQVRNLLQDTTSQVDEQSRAQKDRLAETVRSFSQDLDSMTSQAEGTDGVAGQVVRQVADQARDLANRLDDREPRELLDDVRSFARRRPGTFLLGALAAGVVVGRLTRGAKAAHDDSPGTSAAPQGGAQLEQPVTVGNVPPPPVDELAPSVGARPSSEVPVHTDLGAKGVEMSETGAVGRGGGRP